MAFGLYGKKKVVNNRVERCTLESRRPRSGHFQEHRRRSETRKYTFVDNDGVFCQVCKDFFFSTLGCTSDMFITTLCRATDRRPTTPPPDKLGRYAPTNKTDEHDQEETSRHIESSNPCVPQYRCAHAPNRRYLPSELTVTVTWNDFKAKHPAIGVSSDTSRRIVRKKKIGFTKLGEEECEVCKAYERREHNDLNANDTCKDCTEWK